MTQNEIKSFSASMAKRCRVTIVNRSKIGFVAKLFRKYVLRRFAKYLPDLSDELRPCCLRIFRRFYVFLSFDVGDPQVSFKRQRDVIVHECQHAFDVREYLKKKKKRVSNWVKNYLFDDTFRAWAEASPNTAEAEVVYFDTGRYPNPVCDYDAYLIDEASAKRIFRNACETRKQAVLSRGRDWIPTQEAARAAIEILNTQRR